MFARCIVVVRRHFEWCAFCLLMIRRPPRSTLDRSSAASDVYKRQNLYWAKQAAFERFILVDGAPYAWLFWAGWAGVGLSLIHISEPTRPY